MIQFEYELKLYHRETVRFSRKLSLEDFRELERAYRNAGDEVEHMMYQGPIDTEQYELSSSGNDGARICNAEHDARRGNSGGILQGETDGPPVLHPDD